MPRLDVEKFGFCSFLSFCSSSWHDVCLTCPLPSQCRMWCGTNAQGLVRSSPTSVVRCITTLERAVYSVGYEITDSLTVWWEERFEVVTSFA